MATRTWYWFEFFFVFWKNHLTYAKRRLTYLHVLHNVHTMGLWPMTSDPPDSWGKHSSSKSGGSPKIRKPGNIDSDIPSETNGPQGEFAAVISQRGQGNSRDRGWQVMTLMRWKRQDYIWYLICNVKINMAKNKLQLTFLHPSRLGFLGMRERSDGLRPWLYDQKDGSVIK